MKLGLLISPYHGDWPALRAAGMRADELGYDSVWTADHVAIPLEDGAGPVFEGYLTLASWAENTQRVRLGLMVGANTFRNPALVVKMVTTLDHMSNGRMYLGIGAAWFEPEHTAFGFEFGSSAAERLAWLDEAVALIHDLLPGGPATARGPHYQAMDVVNNPPPVQKRVPILIGGAGERKTLATVARYADAWNYMGFDVETARHKDAVLRRWCDEVGRDHAEIERSLFSGSVVIRDTVEEAQDAAKKITERSPGYEEWLRVGPPELHAEYWAPFVELGFRHIVAALNWPYDEETLERLVGEVKPMLAP